MRNKNELRSEIMRACAETEEDPATTLDFVCESMKAMIDIKRAPEYTKQSWRQLLIDTQRACRKFRNR